MEVHNIFKIQKTFCLGGDDLFVLSQLYLPLIGIDSFSLYFALSTLDEKEQYQIKRLLDMLSINSSTHLKASLDKLQGVALLSNLYNDGKDLYLFQLKPPLNAECFFENTLLSSFLQSQIGQVEYDKLRGMRKVAKTPGYKDITKSFDEVYKVENLDFNKILPKTFINKMKNDITIKNSKFDYALFVLSFDTNFFDLSIFDDEEFKNEILKISFNYNLNEEEMKEALLKTIDIDKDIKYKDIAKNARSIYNMKNKNVVAKFVTKSPDPYIASDLDEDSLKILEMLERMSLVSILESLSYMKASSSELAMLENLARISGLPQEVINVMILYVNNEKQGVFPGYSYFEKIASTWKRAGIKTAREALEYINKPKSKSSFKKVKETPEWLNKYEEEHKNIKSKELTEEETQKVLEEAQKMFKVKEK